MDLETIKTSGAYRRTRTGSVRPAPIAFIVGPGAAFAGRGPSVPRREAEHLNFDHLVDPRSLSLEDQLISKVDRDPHPRPRGNRPPYVDRLMLEFAHVDGDVRGLAQVLEYCDGLGIGYQVELSRFLEAWRAA